MEGHYTRLDCGGTDVPHIADDEGTRHGQDQTTEDSKLRDRSKYNDNQHQGSHQK